ncbi:hypothetical protein ES731_15390 [Psychroflexus gondwanensis]|uniref:hypothetical protein n=1 Tax=Psychroflexus gondwanensis TaxID=251 RepID=UPI0011BE867D|nr:hypothetical protein [Psychroflexus gondwanensis]TXE15392.1 hypothetical protein ES731_15390 [Psychroflexus gondwanensis]
MEFGKQKSGEERIMEQCTSETVCFAWRNRFCSFLRHKNKPSPQSFGDWFLPILRDWAMQKRKENINDIESWINLITSNYFSIQYSIENHLPTKERRQARSDK